METMETSDVPKQAASLFDSFFSPKASSSLESANVNEEESAEIPQKIDVATPVLKREEDSAEPEKSNLGSFFGTSPKPATKKEVSVNKSVDDMVAKEEVEDVDTMNGIFDSFFGADSRDHKKLPTNGSGKSSNQVSAKLESQLDLNEKPKKHSPSPDSMGSIFESFLGPKKSTKKVVNQEVTTKEKTLSKEKKKDFVAHNYSEPSSVFDQIFGASKPTSHKSKSITTAENSKDDAQVTASTSVLGSMFGNSSPSKIPTEKNEKKEVRVNSPTKEDGYDIVAADPISDAFASFFGTKPSSTKSSKPNGAGREPHITSSKPKKSFPLFFAGEYSHSEKQKVESKKATGGNQHKVQPKLEKKIKKKEKKEHISVFGRKSGGNKGVTFSLFSRDATRLQNEVASTLQKEARSKTAQRNGKSKSMGMFGGSSGGGQKQGKVLIPSPPPLPYNGKNGALSFEQSTKLKRASTSAVKIKGRSSSATRAITDLMSPMSITKNTNLKQTAQKPSQPKQKIRPGKTFVLAKAMKSFPSNGIKNDGIPLLTQWKQNKDGSITGRISNSKVFRSGQKITTSPAKKGAKKGVVTTNSGSKYRLM